VENRRWSTRYRGPLLIHAGKSREWLEVEEDDRADWPSRYGIAFPPAQELVFGALLGVVELVGVGEFNPGDADPFASGPYCWYLRNPRAFAEPVPYRGRQMLFDVPAEVCQGVVELPLFGAGSFHAA